MLNQVLEKIGLNEKEIVIYLAALKLGPQPASVIARAAALNRSTTYTILESLFKKGLVSQFVKAEVKYFSVISPESLVSYVERIINDYKRSREELIEVMPQFLTLTSPVSIKPKTIFLEGPSAIKDLFQKILLFNGEIYCVCRFEKNFFVSKKEKTISLKQDSFFSKIYHKKRLLPLIVAPTKIINPIKKDLFKSSHFNQQSKIILINDSIFPKEVEIYLYSEKTLFILENEKNLFSILIEDKNITASLKVLIIILQRLKIN